jgi:hypothetical protein
MAHHWRIRSLVTGSWAKEVDILGLTISSWTVEQDEAWISDLLDVKELPDEGIHAPIEESAYPKRTAERDRQSDALLQIAKNHNCELVPIIAPQR